MLSYVDKEDISSNKVRVIPKADRNINNNKPDADDLAVVRPLQDTSSTLPNQIVRNY